MLETQIHQALSVCLSLNSTERALIVTDEETRQIGEAFWHGAKAISPAQNHDLVVMEDLGERHPDHPLQFPDSLRHKMADVDVSIYAATGKPGELASFRKPMMMYVVESKRIRHGHMPGVTAAILTEGFGDNYQQVVNLTNKVYHIVKNSATARVTSALGTDLQVSFNPDYKWVPSHAIIGPGQYGNIPSGEVFTCVETCEGRIVIDGEIGDYLCARYGILSATPITIDIRNGRANNISCVNKELVRDLEDYFKIDDNANRVGEFAIGTNINLKAFIGNLLLDEKFPGIHIAFGSGYPDKTGATWNGKAHLDCIITKPTVTIDERVIMETGIFNPEIRADI
jgi:aminopeptidase